MRFIEGRPPAMTPDETRAYLESHPGWVILTSCGRDGFPHSVPMGYFLLGDEIWMGCYEGTQKAMNIARNPRVSLVVQSGARSPDLKGVMIQGEARLVTGDAERLEISRQAARARGVAEADLPQQARPRGVLIGVRPVNTISWDYSKRG